MIKPRFFLNNQIQIFTVHRAGLVVGFGRDFEALVPKTNEYLMCEIHNNNMEVDGAAGKLFEWGVA